MWKQLNYFFKLNDELEKQAKVLDLATEYEVKPSHSDNKVEIWYSEDGEDKYSLYLKDIVEEKIAKGLWIKI